MKKIIIALAALVFAVTSCNCSKDISLAGKWKVSLDSLSTFSPIVLPGTLDDAGLGEPSTLEPAMQLPQLQSLRRKNSYIGPAYYIRTFNVPASKAGKPLALKLERVLWQSQVWIDGEQLEGAEESLVTPHRYAIPAGLSAGKHEIKIMIDNRKRYDISNRELAHAYTNDTQIKWNGILGEMTLKALESVDIAQVDVYPHAGSRSADLKIKVLRTDPDQTEAKLVITSDCGKKFTMKAELCGEITEVKAYYEFADDAKLWDEFNPVMHKLTVQTGKSSKTVNFGIRDIKIAGNDIEINGRSVFFRGTLDCCIFPLTGTPPTDDAGWEKVIKTCKAWGLNHIRFHSYCPPDAAFRVADKEGFYLQVELPIWSGATVYKHVQDFLMSETDRILDNYGNHPSFCMLSGGNELNSGYDYLNEWLRYLKAKDSRHIYTNATYSMGAGHKGYPEPEDQYMIASRSYLGQVRGQDYIDSREPDFRSDYSATAIDQGVPMISHEIGQYSVYPNIAEIDKYTGVLEPLNFMSVKADLEQKGLIQYAADFTMASGKLSALLYKEEVERALKTPGLSGFQLLGLQDFPGQCTALVGLVDSFWDNKGLVTEKWFRQACSPVTPLIRYEKVCWTSDETFKAGVEFANYWKEDITGTAEWKCKSAKETIGSGSFPISLVNGRTDKLTDSIFVNLSSVSKPQKFTITLSIKNTEWTNSWDFWVYPAKAEANLGDVVVAQTLEDAVSLLEEGKKVLLTTSPRSINGTTGKFVPVFWSPVFFAGEPGTMGILCDPKHPAFAGFPTEFHSNWQWWNLTKNSSALNISTIPQVTTILRAIDNFNTNRDLAYIFECKCGNGKLLFSTMDLLGERVADKPEVACMYRSLLDYMNSNDFDPKGSITTDELMSFKRQPRTPFPWMRLVSE